MAKISFSKLKLVKDTSTKTIEWGDNKIEIKQYLPLQEKLNLIASVLNIIQDENNFINNAKLDAMLETEIVLHYAELSLTEKQREDLWKIYDLMHSSGFAATILNQIPEEEINLLVDWMNSIAEHIYEYRNSIYGILDAVSTDYSALAIDTEKIQEQIANPENAKLLKNVLTKVG